MNRSVRAPRPRARVRRGLLSRRTRPRPAPGSPQGQHPRPAAAQWLARGPRPQRHQLPRAAPGHRVGEREVRRLELRAGLRSGEPRGGVRHHAHPHHQRQQRQRAPRQRHPLGQLPAGGQLPRDQLRIPSGPARGRHAPQGDRRSHHPRRDQARGAGDRNPWHAERIAGQAHRLHRDDHHPARRDSASRSAGSSRGAAGR